MNKGYVLCIAALTSVSVFAQSRVTYNTNMLVPGDERVLTKIEYTDNSVSGPAQYWDFSGAKEVGTMVIKHNQNAGQEVGNLNLSSSNTLLACDEGGEKDTYFEISKSRKMYWGLKSMNTFIEFNEPITDLAFPFSYGDILTGPMDGKYTDNSNKEYSIEGQYFTSADAWGTIVLPDGATYDNVLRIKVEKIYKQPFGSVNYDIHTIRYQYFAPGVRYPVMIALVNDITSDCNCACGKSHTEEAYYQTQTALKSLKSYSETYADNGESADFQMTAFPNPFNTVLNLQFTAGADGSADIDIVDGAGKLVKSFGKYQVTEGDNEVSLNTSDLGLGHYVVRAVYKGETYTLSVFKK